MILEPLARGDEAPGVGVDAPAQLAGDIEGFSLIVKQLAFALSVTGQRGWDIEEPAARIDPVFNVRAHRKGATVRDLLMAFSLGNAPAHQLNRDVPRPSLRLQGFGGYVEEVIEGGALSHKLVH